ncbi:hypothetical protein BKA61DRAFT_660166 [Leptodontidium sp. MPI-SDFR-AT-0119]|nr:hypothetical protein BKA61DRAFT_660166 [Leptodontidium sp. MPI-SDFR-AT-0119]
MTDSKALPVILFGKLPSVTTPQIEALLPEIDVIHLITSLPSARIELPSLLSLSHQPKPTITHPSSGKGSNTARSPSQQKRAMVVIVGGGFSEEEFEELEGVG